MSALPAELTDIMKLHANGKVEEARNGYLRLLEKNPQNAEILHLAGLTYFQSGDMVKGNQHMQQAAAQDPHNFRHTQKLVEIEKKAGNPKAAIKALDLFLTHNPGMPEAVQELLNLGLNNKVFEPVIKHLNALIAEHPADLTLRQLMLLTLTEAEMYAEAVPHYEALIKADPLQPAKILQGYGKGLLHAGRAAEGIPLAEEWQLRFPGDAEMVILQASNFSALAMPEKSLAEYRKAIDLEPDKAGYRMSAGIAQFLLTGMQEGYDDYTWRHQLDNATPFDFTIPEWKGESLEGKRLVLWAEQGVGDIIMFLSLIPPLVEEAQKVTLLVYPKLLPLIRESFPDVDVQLADTYIVRDAATHYDMHSSLGELMRYVLPRYTPAEHPPFLKVSDAQRDTMRARMEEKAKARGAKRIVGISWFSSNKNTGPYRNIPLTEWAPLLSNPDILFVSLQYSSHADELAEMEKQFPGAIFTDSSFDRYEDMSALAAQVAAVDEVITIQNATAHMAGALGVPTTLLLSAASDWRWSLERSDSRWYGSVTIKRQQKVLDWKPVMQDMAAELSARK